MRLFLALDIPDRVREKLARWRDGLLTGRFELRPLAPESLHVTLVFLGRMAPGTVDDVWSAARAAARDRGAPVLAPTGLRSIPPRRPRLFALDLSDEGGRAAALHGAVTAALAAADLHEPEPRPFWAHVTLARVRRGERPTPLAAQAPRLDPFPASRLTLYRSDTRQGGARYTALERLELGP